MSDSIANPAILRAYGEVYRLAGSLLLLEPSPELLLALKQDAFWDGLERLLPVSEARNLRGRLCSSDWDLSDLRVEFHRLFTAPKGKYVFPYESCYCVPTPPGPLLGEPALQVMSVYSEAGCQVASGFPEPPDHAGLELAFVGETFTQEARLREEGKDDEAVRLAALRSRFLQEHPRRWFGALAAQVRAVGGGPFYVAVAELAVALAAGGEPCVGPDRSWGQEARSDSSRPQS